MLYTALDMAATRTQIYLTKRQRAELDELGRREDKSLAELIREAVDLYLERGPVDVHTALKESFGSCPDLEVPDRSEWDRGYG
jgi:Ribbon-helix-helix protein, copG family